MNVAKMFQDTLQSNGLSLTKPRKRIFHELQNAEPMTTGELISRVKDSVDRASVYRTILLFEKLDIIHRVHTGWKYRLELSPSYSHHHHHMSCTACGKLYTIDEDPLIESQIHLITERYGFRATNHQLEIQGTCQSCLRP